MLANVCLLIAGTFFTNFKQCLIFYFAAKFEENSSDIPKIFELNLLLPKSYSVTEYKSWEVVVLDFFSWYVRFPTAAHYTHYYLKAALTQEDIDHTSIKSYYTLFYQIHHHVLNYLNEVLNSELLASQPIVLVIKKLQMNIICMILNHPRWLLV